MNLLNFAFGNVRDDPMLLLLEKVYGVQTHPTLVVDGKVFHKSLSKEEILELICPKFKTKHDICEGYQSYTVTQPE